MLLGLGSVLMAGCAVQGPPFEKAYAPPGDTVIYVYRPYSYAGSLLRPPVTCDDETADEQTARIGPGGYHAFLAPAGQKLVCSVPSTETNDDVEIHAEPRVYYIREEIGWGVLTGHHISIRSTPIRLRPKSSVAAYRSLERICCKRQ
jgi:hypothetical protein